jgi:flagellar biosynthesis GTPase FlhF
MLRIALILALLTAGGALVVSQFVVKDKVVELNDTLNTTTQNLNTTTEAKNKAEADAKVSKAAAEAATKELADTKTARDEAVGELDKQRTRAEGLQTELTKVTKDRNEARQEVARWQALGVQPEQVKVLQSDLRKAGEEREEVVLLNKGLNKQLTQALDQLAKYEQDKEKVVEMPGLKGSIVATSGQWNFVVLDVGENGGAKPGGIVMVRRGDKLIGKARIVTVEPSRSIANLIGEWSQGNVAVAAGDSVLY